MRNWIDKSNSNFRIPQVVSTKSTGLRIQMIYQSFESMNLNVTGFDLRKAWFSQRNGTIKEYMLETKLNLAQAIAEGWYFWMNIDDNNLGYKENYDPDFKEYYNKDFLPYHIFDLKIFRIPEVYKRVQNDTPFEGRNMNSNFKVVQWSNFKVNDGIDKNKMKDQIERRFGILLPLDKIDMIIYRLSYNTIMMSKTGSRFDLGLARGKTGMQGTPLGQNNNRDNNSGNENLNAGYGVRETLGI